MQRLVAALIVIALALCGLWSVVHWSDDPNPLLIDAAGCAPPVKLPNPCDTTNCFRRPTREIA